MTKIKSDPQESTSEAPVPQVAHGAVPLWIKVMWALGIFWILFYIFLGLRSTPLSW